MLTKQQIEYKKYLNAKIGIGLENQKLFNQCWKIPNFRKHFIINDPIKFNIACLNTNKIYDLEQILNIFRKQYRLINQKKL